ncbi:MAG: N-glycosylase/DNA lyase [Candidatus Eisenbacteria bacterium]|nr:N-glycosylase/DNA lyase [Candidatus Eisenbacteria bacterium]
MSSSNKLAIPRFPIEISDPDDLIFLHQLKKDEIHGRLREFEKKFQEDDSSIFSELCFCILTANSSAMSGFRGIESLGDILLKGTRNALRARLRGRHRFWRTRASYIFHTREYLRKTCGLKLKERIVSFSDRDGLRDSFAADPGIKGIGYKEASHFLRNIGFRGYAILDRHILGCLSRLGVIDWSGKGLTPANYRRIEAELRNFASSVGIDMDELDLLLWWSRTGAILK